MQRTALISVYDKTGIAEFARELITLNFKILASDGTAKHLQDTGVPVEDVAELVGARLPDGQGGAILGHRVVTLSREVHAGLLAKNTPEDRRELNDSKIPFIDLVCCDFYPLEKEIKNPEATKESVIEKTDIGGPAMVRSGAKGGRITICDRDDRKKVIKWLQSGEPDRENFINNLRAKAEAAISRYCATSAEYHSGGLYESIFGKKVLECAYGENAYQKPASLYRNHKTKMDSLAVHNWILIAGNPLSYNNICDLDRMMQTITHIGAGMEKNQGVVPEVAVGVKHGNACGAGMEENAVGKMLQGDLRAIFGGSVMFNFPVDEKIANELIHKYSGDNRRLLDIVAAPSFTAEAIEILSRKKGKCRLLSNPAVLKAGLSSLDAAERFRYVRGGFMLQPNYTFIPDLSKTVFDKNMSRTVLDDIILAWAVGCTSNSNTITLVKDGRLVGNGVGQQDRVGAAKLAIFRADEAARFKAAEQKKNSSAFLHPAGGTFRVQNSSSAPLSTEKQADLEGAVAYSDSFFPFPDAPEALIDRGIKTIFSTSGSVNDGKIIELCKQKGISLILLPDSEGRGFYQH